VSNSSSSQDSTTKKIKVAVCDLVTSFGGVQRVMGNILPQLAEQFDIYAVDPYANKDYAQMLCGTNVTLYFTEPTFKKTFIGGAGTWKRLPAMITAIPRLLKIRSMFIKAITEICPDCIYTNQLSAFRLLRTIGCLCDIPMIYHSHGYTKVSDISPSCVRCINSRVLGVIAVSRSVADVLCQAGIRPDIIQVCYNGVFIEEIERCARLPISTPLPHKPSGQVVFLLPASIYFNKGQHLTLAALAEIVEDGCNAAVWFAGDVGTGGDRKYLEELRKKTNTLGISHLVHFLGHRDDIYQVMNAADVVMLCSMEYESFGMVLAEAMVLGKPCIGADIGGMPEVIADKHTGLIFTPGSVDSLANAMTQLTIDAEMRDAFGKAGRLRVEKFFTITTQANRISAIIDSINS
jgi:glycosyltransferase involved in cell wall biosynthesis